MIKSLSIVVWGLLFGIDGTTSFPDDALHLRLLRAHEGIDIVVIAIGVLRGRDHLQLSDPRLRGLCLQGGESLPLTGRSEASACRS